MRLRWDLRNNGAAPVAVEDAVCALCIRKERHAIIRNSINAALDADGGELLNALAAVACVPSSIIVDTQS